MLEWPLMKNNITLQDRFAMAKFCLTSDRFTNGPKVAEFEQRWAKWINSKHALYVSSGSTANYVLLAAVKELYNLKDGDKVVVPACTWVTNVNPVFQLGLQPIFCDVDSSFTYCEQNLRYIANKHNDIKIVFTTHLMGFPAPVHKYKEIFPNAIFLDDVCESHGCKNNDNTKVGSDSIGATFSFYFGHHMCTIEGGMVCTNNTELYDLMRLKRSHGLARESKNKQQYFDANPTRNRDFLFVTDGYNFRNHEIGAVLGISQLKRLDKMIEVRNKNYKNFVDVVKQFPDLLHDPVLSKGISSYCFPLVFWDSSIKNKFELQCLTYGIEHRPIIGGNLLNQPYLQHYKIENNQQNHVDILDEYGLYLGNNHFVGPAELLLLRKILESI
jgi:CDP-6-deoxy-D-xylo-4-hexulose-3-dehydrase